MSEVDEQQTKKRTKANSKIFPIIETERERKTEETEETRHLKSINIYLIYCWMFLFYYFSKKANFFVTLCGGFSFHSLCQKIDVIHTQSDC